MEAVLIALLTLTNIYTLIFFKGREEKIKGRFNSYLSKLDLENEKLKKSLNKKSGKPKSPRDL